VTHAASELLVHIGYHKTGTTWLQERLFTGSDTGFTRPWDSSVIRTAFVLPDHFEFDPVEATEIFAPGRSEATALGLVPVISDERLSGSPHAGGYDSTTIADRLAAAFTEARVLIVIREQRGAIYAMYQQFVRDGGSTPLAKYLAPRAPAEIPQFRFAHYEYHHLIAHYFTLFGRDRVLVLPFELLRTDPRGFVQKICSFAGTIYPASVDLAPLYEAWGALTIAAKRQANRLLVRNALNPSAPLYVRDHEARFLKLDRRLPRRWSARIEHRERELTDELVGERYAASNRTTSDLLGTDLATYGYLT